MEEGLATARKRQVEEQISGFFEVREQIARLSEP
jgi:hypothetical protein